MRPTAAYMGGTPVKNETAGRAGNGTHCSECGHPLATTKPAARADDGGELISLVAPVPGAEAMYADFLARVAEGSRKMETGRKRQPRKCRPMKFKYPTGDRYGHGDWIRSGSAPLAVVSVPAGEHDDDYLWRQRFPTLDRFLAHCEVAGRVLRRYATAGGYGQRLELPVRPGSLEVGEVLELTADEIRFQCCELAGSVWPGVPATSAA